MIEVSITPGFYSVCGVHEQRVPAGPFQLPMHCVWCERALRAERDSTPIIRHTLSGQPVINQAQARRAALASALAKLSPAQAAPDISNATVPPSERSMSGAASAGVVPFFKQPKSAALRGKSG